jgi:hypothetical protein
MRKPKKTAARRRATHADTLTDAELRERIDSENADVFAALEGQLRSSLGVIPFVGAGMSAGIKLDEDWSTFPQWGKFLRGIAKGTPVEAKVEALLKAGNYESAASTVDKCRPNTLPQRIRDAFDRQIPDAQVLGGPVSYLPLLATGPVITTNYDRVLERAFKLAGRDFNDVISGPLPDAIVDAIQKNRRDLIKIHGNSHDSTFRVLTGADYESAYGSMSGKGAASKAVDIGKLSWLLYTNRPLLFLGCSLENDRTVQVLRAIKAQFSNLTHYAVMSADRSRRRWFRRQKHLDALGIRSLWFFPGRYEEIESLLSQVLERASTRRIDLPKAVAPIRKPGSAQMPKIVAELRGKRRQARNATRHSAEIDLIANTIYDGRLAFFLGAYASLAPKFLGKEFYDSLAKKFELPKLVGDRTAVASFISSRYGSEALLKEVRELFDRNPIQPSVVHRFIAALPAFLRGKQNKPLWILTTNYDTLMEQALTDAGEEFELLYYVNDVSPYYDSNEVGRGGGGFIERSPDGRARLIEKPDNLRHPRSAAHVIVKLNGGLDFFRNTAEQVSIDRADFERLAARIPAVLPDFVRSELQARSFLFLGHGMAEPDVHQLIEFTHRDRKLRSWALQLAPSGQLRGAWEADASYWRGWGLQFLDDDLKRFIAALSRQISRGRR